MKAWHNYFFLIILASCGACKEETPVYGKHEMYSMAVKADPTTSLVLADSIENALEKDPCAPYAAGCIVAVKARIKRLEVIFVQFATEREAIAEAKRIDQYYARNWVIDDIVDEPALEKFVKEVYGAIRPLKPE